MSERNDSGAEHDLSLNSSMDGSMDRGSSRPIDLLSEGQHTIYISGSKLLCRLNLLAVIDCVLITRTQLPRSTKKRRVVDRSGRCRYGTYYSDEG